MIPWQRVALAVYIGVNVGLLLYGVRFGPDNIDWSLWASLPELIERGDIYAPSDFPFVWSPLAAYLMAGVSFLGYWPWVALHVAFVFLLRDWRLIGLVLISYPFWVDAALGNTLTFQVVAGMLVLRSERWSFVYLALAVLIPRPLIVPLVVWLLWKQPRTRLRLVAMAVVLGLATLFSGYTVEWITTALEYGRSDIVAEQTIGPVALIGPAWLLVGLPLGAWLTWRGWPGLAGMAISPYLFAYYLLMPLVDLVPKDRKVHDGLRHKGIVEQPVPLSGSQRHESVAPHLPKIP